ncbi:hypothetical protein AAP_01943 [Ascosphaera apis ARSEF 7405]|uniref:Uncharacterized protein n=1 Tax=Ascosphaera apis ARSEF 7405 TaxID=392613 RepID=A0A162IK66_9EURO|nr:hypothetical protein AAP_01943 [Ascosphaera apis ARSEF 7405]
MPRRNARQSGRPKSATRSFRSSEEKTAEKTAAKRFQPIPRALDSFVKHLDPQHVYIIHLDREDRTVKFYAMFVSFFINMCIVAFALYRLYVGFFSYPAMISALWNKNSPARNMPADATAQTTIWMLFYRTSGIMIDYLVLNFLVPLPCQFFFEGPVAWRRAIGFMVTEVVVRKDRGWAKTLETDHWYKELKNDTIEEVIIPATAAERLGKTGYYLMDTNWSIDFNAMIQAHRYITQRKAHFDDFRTACLINPDAASEAKRKATREYVKTRRDQEKAKQNDSESVGSSSKSSSSNEDNGWLIWRVDPFDEKEEEKESSQRDKMEQIREKLIDLDKEDVFYRWIEILQFEMSGPGEWDAEKQRKCDDQTRELFKENGLDFDEFYEGIGGMEGVIA